MNDKEANKEVPCPACGGKCCKEWCDNGGTVSARVARTITSETGEVVL